MVPNILIIGAGGVAQVAAHKIAQNNDILGDICIASRTLSKCEDIIASIHRKNHLKDHNHKLHAKQIDALNINDLVNLIKETNSNIVLNLGQSFVNMSVLQACIETKTSYLDTAIHEQPDKVCENPPWYANYEWTKKDTCTSAGINAILGIGFDPGVVNAYCKLATKDFDTIHTIDILDVNAGSHGKYFATNFDPEINFREFTKTAWAFINNQWTPHPHHSIRQFYCFPEIGTHPLYLTGHDEIHSLHKNINCPTIRFWMSFSDHYINIFNTLKNLGLLSEHPVTTAEGQQIVPLKLVKACLPDPKSLAPNYTGKTCIGTLIKGIKDNKPHSIFIYNICDHETAYADTESQAISYTAGLPAAAATILLATKQWQPLTMTNIEELDPLPLINLLNEWNLTTHITSGGTLF